MKLVTPLDTARFQGLTFLRLSYGVMHRLPRVSPDMPIHYQQYIIPPGVSLSLRYYCSCRFLLFTDPFYKDPSWYVCLFDAF